MKLYLISQNVNNDYDTFDSAVVCAENEEKAKRVHPKEGRDFPRIFYNEKTRQFCNYNVYEELYLFEHKIFGSWTNDLSKINVKYLGEANEGMAEGVICASFNAG